MKNFSSKVLTIQLEYGKLNTCTQVCLCYHHNIGFAYTEVVLIDQNLLPNLQESYP